MIFNIYIIFLDDPCRECSEAKEFKRLPTHRIRFIVNKIFDMASIAILSIIIVQFLALNYGFMAFNYRLSKCVFNLDQSLQMNDGTDDLRELNEVMKMTESSLGKKLTNGDTDDILRALKEEQDSRIGDEIISRQFETETTLPVLPDCNNYYSGTYNGMTWHQNSDQVYVYIPIDADIRKSSIEVKFEARYIQVSIDGQDDIVFACFERIIPDGSFWVIEQDDNDSTGETKYIMLDLEKRFRMINWKNLFGGVSEEQEIDDETRRKEMLAKLLGSKAGAMLGENAENIMNSNFGDIDIDIGGNDSSDKDSSGGDTIADAEIVSE